MMDEIMMKTYVNKANEVQFSGRVGKHSVMKCKSNREAALSHAYEEARTPARKRRLHEFLMEHSDLEELSDDDVAEFDGMLARTTED